MTGDHKRVCAVCGGDLPAGSRLYCSDACRLRARRERYAAKRAAGVCVDCGRLARGLLCPTCRQKRRESVERRRRGLAARGLCRDCGRPAAAGHVYCPECLGKVNRATVELRRMRRERGACSKCGREPVYRGGYCHACYAYVQGLSKERRARLRGLALCVVCGAEVEIGPDGNAPPYCREHLLRYYNANVRRYWERREKGLCVDCGRPADEDARGRRCARCPECRERVALLKLRRKLGLPRLRAAAHRPAARGG